MIVTQHAIARYIERVAPRMTADEARAAIEASERVVNVAAGFGCETVIQEATGARLILVADKVVTVIAKGMHKTRRYDRPMGEEL